MDGWQEMSNWTALNADGEEEEKVEVLLLHVTVMNVTHSSVSYTYIHTDTYKSGRSRGPAI